MNTTTEGFWTAHREIEFLETLTHNLRQKYLATMHKRRNWGSIDPFEVEMYLRGYGEYINREESRND